MALPDAAAGDDILTGDLADIFGIDIDPADSGAAAARQKTTSRRRPRRRPRRGGPAPRRPGSSLRAAGWRSCAAGADSRSPSSPACSAYPRRRCTAGKRPRRSLALRAGQEDALQVLYREIEKRQTE